LCCNNVVIVQYRLKTQHTYISKLTIF